MVLQGTFTNTIIFPCYMSKMSHGISCFIILTTPIPTIFCKALQTLSNSHCLLYATSSSLNIDLTCYQVKKKNLLSTLALYSVCLGCHSSHLVRITCTHAPDSTGWHSGLNKSSQRTGHRSVQHQCIHTGYCVHPLCLFFYSCNRLNSMF